MNLAILQARMGSNRLPGKVLKKVNDIPLLKYQCDRLSKSKKINQLIIATSIDAIDNEIEEFAKENQIECFRGSMDNVLERYYFCAKEFKLSASINKLNIVRITGDCPIIDSKLVDEVINYFEKNECNYASNTLIPTFPDGMDIEIFTFNILKEAWKNADLSSEREHVTPYFRNNEKKFNIKNFSHDNDLSHYRWTLDYHEDLELIKIIVNDIIQRPILMKDVLSLFEKNPKLFEINKKYDANEGYKLSLEKDKKGNLDQ